MWQVHLWLGLITGLAVGLVSLTGALIVFRVELNRLTTPGTAYVKPQERRVSIDTMMDSIRQAHPQDKFDYVFFEGGKDQAWNFRTLAPNGHRMHTYVDQYTGAIVGRDDYYDKWLQWLFDLHADLLLGKSGRTANGFIAIALAVMAITGLVVWWPGRSLWRTGFRYETRARWRRQNYDQHKLAGFWSSGLLLLLAFTGAYFSFPELYRNTVGATELFTVPRAKTTQASITFEDFIHRAEQALPGINAVNVAFPKKAGDPVTVRLKEENDWHRVGQSYVYFEPTGPMIRAERWREQSWGLSLIRFMSPLHFGRFGEGFGLGYWPVWIILGIYLLAGLAPPVLLVSGVLMYWNRDLSKRWAASRRKSATSNLKPRSRLTRMLVFPRSHRIGSPVEVSHPLTGNAAAIPLSDTTIEFNARAKSCPSSVPAPTGLQRGGDPHIGSHDRRCEPCVQHL